jgi:hypothetical protein
MQSMNLRTDESAEPQALVGFAKSIFGALTLLLVFSPAGICLADNNKSPQSVCEGPVAEPHPYGNSTFYTNSRIEPINLGRYKYQVISCVTDADPVNSMRVKWLTPGPDGFVPPHEKLESGPRMSEVGLDPVAGTNSDALIKQLDGCILYGDRGDTTAATFFGIAGDTSRVAAEGQVGCRAATAGSSPSSWQTEILDILHAVRNFFPSDTKSPNETMLQLDGNIGVKRVNNDGYESIFTYTLLPFNGSKGDAKQIKLQPLFTGATESLLPAFEKENGNTVELSEKGYVRFQIGHLANPSLTYARYGFINAQGENLGSISLPVFIQGK